MNRARQQARIATAQTRLDTIAQRRARLEAQLTQLDADAKHAAATLAWLKAAPVEAGDGE